MRLAGKQLLLPIIVISILWYSSASYGEAELDFDMSEFQPSAFEFKGYAQLQSEMLSIDQSAAAYQLLYDETDNYNRIGQTTGSLELEASYKKGISRFLIRTYSSRFQNTLGVLKIEHDVYEGYMSLQPDPGLTLDVGNKLMRWGKGYAWNPVGFVERKKDPSDPELSREGYWLYSMDFIRSMQGDLKTIALTPVVIPVNGSLNDDFGESGHNNLGVKLYLLYRDTDIDFLFLSGGSKTARYGMDFSHNIAPHFEIHGEYAYIKDVTRTSVAADCTAGVTQTENVSSYLLGLRYRTEADVNYIFEHYYNGEGHTEEELRLFYGCVHDAWNDTTDDLLNQLKAGGSLNDGSYTTQNPMQHYLHLKSWWNEPYDILYFTPGVQVFYNMNDGSYSVAPEIMYTGLNNFQLRVRVKYFSDDLLTEYGEKISDTRYELRLRYYF